MSISDGLGLYIFRRKLEKTRRMKEEFDGNVFVSRQSQRFLFIVKMVKMLYPVCTLTWRVNNCVSRQGKGIKRTNESSTV